MAQSNLLGRNVRPRRVADDYDDDDSQEENVDHSEDQGAEESGEDMSEGENEDNGDDDSMEEDVDVENQISNVSFGALKKAQDTLSRKRKRGSEATADQDSKLEALRARLQQIKKGKAKDTETEGLNGSKTKSKSSSKPFVKVTEDDDEDENEDSDSDSAPSEEEAGTKSRGSKHAPAAQSTKYQVSRKRQVIDVPKRVTRDPRFDAMQDQSTLNPNQAKAYSFLREYEESEIAELKAAIKKGRNDDDKETLRRKMVAMQNRHKAKDAADREREVLRRHRKEERERINDGKTPYYLKQKEVKERALVDKFKAMKGKERQKVIDKKRKKESQKEKKRMPQARRID